MKMTRKEATKRLNEARMAMVDAKTREEVDKCFSKSCRLQSALYPASCANKDCRYCFLERERNLNLQRLANGVHITINGNVTINGTIIINGHEVQ